VYEARLNGEPVGELALNAAMAGVHRVAVALVSGDQALAAEARALLAPAPKLLVQLLRGCYWANTIPSSLGRPARKLKTCEMSSQRSVSRPALRSCSYTWGSLDASRRAPQVARRDQTDDGSRDSDIRR
jgi:D-aminopeptidase